MTLDSTPVPLYLIVCGRIIRCLSGVILLFLLLNQAHADTGVQLSNSGYGQTLQSGAQYLIDESGDISIDSLIQQESSPQAWQPVKNGKASFGYNPATFWIKQTVTNSSTNNRDWIISFDYSLIDYLNVYYVSNNTLIQAFETGDRLPFYQRPIESKNFLFPLDLPQKDTVTVYFRLQTEGIVKAPIFIWSQKRYQRQAESLTTWQGMFVGALLVMALYNAFLFFSVKDRSYAYYIGFLLFELLAISEYNGFNYQYLWPNSPLWNSMSLPFCMNGLVIFGCLFMKNFLNLKNTAPIHDRFAMIFIVIGTLFLFGSLTLSYTTILRPTVVLTALGAIYAFYLSASLWLKGVQSARFITIAWAALLSSGLILLIASTGFVQGNAIIDSTVQISAILEVSLLSIALGDRINQERQAKMIAQKALMETHRQAKDVLEDKVSERTNALEEANKKLMLINTLDPLTGLKNRRYFNDYLEKEFKRANRSKTPIAIFMIDIDHFKPINDTYGHQIGDQCIIAVANTLTDVVRRPSDAVARYGGEEVTIVLANTPPDGAMVVAERIRSSVEQLTIYEHAKDINLTISIGVHCETPSDHSMGENAVSCADKALYDAKESGRNCIVLSTPETHDNQSPKQA